MFRILIALLAFGTAAPAAAHHIYTPPATPHPLPQGVPYLVVGATPHPVGTLRFAIIHGRRALVDPETGRVAYFLIP